MAHLIAEVSFFHSLPGSTQNQSIRFTNTVVFQLLVRIWKLQAKVNERSDHFPALNKINTKPVSLYIWNIY